MTNRRDIDRLNAAQRRLVELARRDLTSFFASLDLTRPEAARNALLEIVPILAREYGNIASIAAAEWYEDIRPGAWNARTTEGFPRAGIEQGTRFHAGALFDADPEQTLRGLSGAMQRYVGCSTRETIARNVQLDPLRPRFARVPSGAQTCAWCGILASRGFVYVSRETAGILEGHFHDDCDCQIVAEFDSGPAFIEGYDPDRLYDRYLTAREQTGAVTDKEIAAAMRELFPDEFKDGHVH